MNYKTRQVIFYFFVLLFLVATPVIILYSFGFSFGWHQGELTLSETGAFYFKTIPRDADIFIDGQPKEKTPAFVNQIKPGVYYVKISKDGYYDWTKSLTVESMLVTEARNILLVPKNPKFSIVKDNATSTSEDFLTLEEKTSWQIASTTMASKKNIASWTVFEKNIYFLATSSLLFKTDLKANGTQQLSFVSLPVSLRPYKISVFNSNIAVFQPQGNIYLFNPEEKLFNQVGDDANGLSFSPDGKKILWWNKHEIFSYWVENVLIQPVHRAGEKELITRLSDTILQATWFGKTNEHIFFVLKNEESDPKETIKIIELDGRSQRNMYDIIWAKNIEIFWNQQDNLLYFLRDKKLFSLDLIY